MTPDGFAIGFVIQAILWILALPRKTFTLVSALYLCSVHGYCILSGNYFLSGNNLGTIYDVYFILFVVLGFCLSSDTAAIQIVAKNTQQHENYFNRG